MPYDIGPINGGNNLGVTRLLALADHVETVADKDYDHHFWRRELSGGGCVMCALGQGVTALPHIIGLRWGNPHTGEADIVRLDGTGLTENTITLAAEAFEISIDDAMILFGMGPSTAPFYGVLNIEDVKPQNVAGALRRFALERVKETA